jgi:hypothetical protein
MQLSTWVENLSPAIGRGIDSRNRVWNWVAKLHRLAGRYDIPMPTWFLALIAGHKFRHSVADGSPYPDRVGSTSFCRIRIDKHYFFPKNFKLLSKILRIMTHWTLIRNVKLCKQALLWLKVFFSYSIQYSMRMASFWCQSVFGSE